MDHTRQSGSTTQNAVAAHGNGDAATPGLAMPTAIPGLALRLCPLAADGGRLATLESTLSPPELARANRLGTAALRQRYVIGRATLRDLLASTLGMTPQSVPLRRGDRGRPELDLPRHALDFNVSHTRDVVLIAILRRSAADTRVGVDIEHLDRAVGADRLARRYLTDGERERLHDLGADERRRRFLRLWTCKEAMSKATGDGLRAPMGRLDVELSGGPRLIAGPAPYLPPDWRLESHEIAGGFVAAVALWIRWSGADREPGADPKSDAPTAPLCP